jgi:hypothetical protein
MKNFKIKLVALLSVIGFSFFFIACSTDEGDKETMVQIVVKKDGIKQSGITVCIFSEPPTSSMGNNPLHAMQEKVSNSDGIVTFILREGIELHAIKETTTLHFTALEKVGENKYTVLGSASKEVKKFEYLFLDLPVE